MKMPVDGQSFAAMVSAGYSDRYKTNILKDDSGNLTFHNWKVENICFLKTFGSNGQIEFRECVFDNDLKIGPHLHGTTLIFTNCIFSGLTTFTEGHQNILVFNECHFAHLNFLKGKYSYIQINGCTGHFSLTEFAFTHFSCGSWTNTLRNRFDTFVFNSDQSMGTLQILRSSFGYISIKGMIPKDASAIVDSIEAKHFELSWLTVEGLLRINNVVATDNYIPTEPASRYTLEEQSYFNTVFQKPVFLINKSDLGKSHISSVNLKQFHFISVGQSNVQDVNFSNIIWPEKISPYTYVEQKELLNFYSKTKLSRLEQLQVRDVYRQIKLSSQKSSDFISEQYFHGKEMNSYYRSLRWRNDFWTKLILRLSFITSNYGQSLWRPFLSMIVAVSILMVILYRTSNSNYRSCDFEAGSSLWSWIAEFMRLANPLHKNNCELKGFPFVMDSLMRIISSYLIYNMVRASRRFVK